MLFELFALRKNGDLCRYTILCISLYIAYMQTARVKHAHSWLSSSDIVIKTPVLRHLLANILSDTKKDKNLSPLACHYINHTPISLYNESVVNMLNAKVVSTLYIQH